MAKGKAASPTSLPARLRVAGYGPFDTAMNVKKDYNNFAPRVGIAYQPARSEDSDSRGLWKEVLTSASSVRSSVMW